MCGYFRIGICFLILCFANESFSQIKFSRTYGAYGAFNQGIAIVEHADNGFLLGCSTGGWDTQNGDILLIRIDSNGTEIWKKTFIYPQTENINALIKAQNGDYLICGQSNSFGPGDWDGFVLRVDADGNFVSLVTLPLIGWQTFHKILELPDGKLIVIGQSFYSGIGEMWMVSFDETGNLLYQSRIMEGLESSANGIALSSDGDVRVCGWAINPISGNKEIVVVNATTDGTTQSMSYYPLNNSSWAEDIVSTPDNRFMLAANTTLPDGRDQPYFLLINAQADVVQSYYSPGNDNWQIKSVGRREDGLFIFGFEFQFNRPVGGFIVFDESFTFMCNGYVPDGGIGSSTIGMAIPTANAWAFIATIGFSSPGNTSIMCVVTDEACDVSQNILVKTLEKDVMTTIQLYPNPSNGQLTIEGLKCMGAQWFIRTADGRVTAKGEISEHHTIDMSDAMQNGLYFLNVRDCSGSDIYNLRFILNR